MGISSSQQTIEEEEHHLSRLETLATKNTAALDFDTIDEQLVDNEDASPKFVQPLSILGKSPDPIPPSATAIVPQSSQQLPPSSNSLYSFFSTIFAATPQDNQGRFPTSYLPSTSSARELSAPLYSPKMARRSTVANAIGSSPPPSSGNPRTRRYRAKMQVERQKRRRSQASLSPGASQLRREVEEAAMSSPQKPQGNEDTEGSVADIKSAREVEAADEEPVAHLDEAKRSKTGKKNPRGVQEQAVSSSQAVRISKRLRKEAVSGGDVALDANEILAEENTLPQPKRSKRLKGTITQSQEKEAVQTPEAETATPAKPQTRGRRKNKEGELQEVVPTVSTPAPLSAKRRANRQKLYGKSPAQPARALETSQQEGQAETALTDPNGDMAAHESAIDDNDDPAEITTSRPPLSTRKRRRSSSTKGRRLRKSMRSRMSSDAIASTDMADDESLLNGSDQEDVDGDEAGNSPQYEQAMEQTSDSNDENGAESLKGVEHDRSIRRTASPLPVPMSDEVLPTESSPAQVEAQGRHSDVKKGMKRQRHESTDDETTVPSTTTPKPKKAKTDKSTQSASANMGSSTQKTKKSSSARQSVHDRLPPLLNAALPTSGTFTATELRRIELAVRMFKVEHGLSDVTFNNLVQERDRTDKTAGELWTALAEALPHRRRKAIQNTCRRRYHNFEQRGKFTEEDDETLRQLMVAHPSKWVYIGSVLGRMADDCKDRWRNYLACGDKRVTDQWTQGEEIELERAVTECRDAIFDEARRKAVEDGEAFVRPDWQSLINWSAVSEKMGLRRSRLQCYQHYKVRQKREASRNGSIAGTTTASFGASPGKNGRIATALRNYGNMCVGDKMEILQAIAETDTFDEEYIPWTSITQAALQRPWTTRDRKVALEEMKTLVKPKADLGDTVKALIRYFKKYYPNQLDDFYDPGPIRSHPSAKKKSISVKKQKKTGAATKEKAFRSAEFVIESENDERVGDLNADPISSTAPEAEDEDDVDVDNAEEADGDEIDEENHQHAAGDEDGDNHAQATGGEGYDDIEQSPPVEKGRHASHVHRLSAASDDIRDSDTERTELASTKRQSRYRSLSLGREASLDTGDDSVHSASETEPENDNEDDGDGNDDGQLDDTFQGRRPLHSDNVSSHTGPTAPMVEETPEPGLNSNIVDLESEVEEEEEEEEEGKDDDDDDDDEMDVKSEPDSEFQMEDFERR